MLKTAGPPMPSSLREPSSAELAILKLLWDRQPLTSREIREQLYPDGSQSDFATVQKLLQRLEEKGYVARDRKEFAHRFRAKVGRDAFAARQLEALADKLTDGSLAPLIMNAVSRKKLTPQQRDEIRRLLDRQE